MAFAPGKHHQLFKVNGNATVESLCLVSTQEVDTHYGICMAYVRL